MNAGEMHDLLRRAGHVGVFSVKHTRDGFVALREDGTTHAEATAACPELALRSPDLVALAARRHGVSKTLLAAILGDAQAVARLRAEAGL